ncbi:MAG: hypothetical protein UU08_C0018G0007 [Candidatus Uhrbacteria bacterium GW2011_GWE2_40_58]|nr:MAG: hypothetical protein UU08_C0018G0007 [Candidatus Uhrbacteria bacterium GW2011_GWE2_40_58]OGL94378.1 MAG: AmmeMemoRadiSam system protein B [Candidatus Uhrbacteria bacterium RIFOXYA2_FULL_40_9]OGL98144.1 MAG: AmmeMemoRadiSam system protein B [Candidatus Uhrbacteria bacterium RIFOXYB2_FULL_41_18]HBK35152.1 AmmeMemoRadiSam system protein B [Candidatus Uhrbacteria bacterium]HCB55728.1 AmmeMemoRadiSam system protein B [Candidatus Uhrbacteria bacterium]
MKWNIPLSSWKFFALLFCLGLGTGFSLFFFSSQSITYDGPLYSSGLQSKSFFDDVYQTVKQESFNQVKAASVVVAHHLLVADQIARTFESISSYPKTIIILSPNHFSSGTAQVQFSQGAWQTPYGEVFADAEAVATLVSYLSFTAIEETTFEKEHGIAALVPFIKKSFPKAQIVPIALASSLDKTKQQQIATALADLFPNALVIASVDMSHELPESVAFFHDQITQSVLEAGGCDQCRLEVDCQPALNILLAINALKGTQTWHLLHRGSSIEMGVTENPLENTSHILGYFTKGKPTHEQASPSLFFVGDIMLDRYVEQLMQWKGVNYPFKNMQRFLLGTNLTIGNLEGTIGEQAQTEEDLASLHFVFPPSVTTPLASFFTTLGLANNHTDDFGQDGYESTLSLLTESGIDSFGSSNAPDPVFETTIEETHLVFIGYHAFGMDAQTVVDRIQEYSTEGNPFIIVFAHWGEEYLSHPTDQQREDARRFVNAGADLIVGHHPHVIQGMEMIENTPVIYSLGNFIFDQIEPATNEGLALGLLFTESHYQLSFFPFEIVQAQPTPLSGTKEQELQKRFASLSQEDLSERIIQNNLIISY